jgi:GNAT superfamily N-acetyltransferase
MNAMLKPKTVIERVPFTKALGLEALPLLHAHWLEVANYRAAIPLDVDWEFYEKLESQGKLLCITARIDGELVGYSVFLVIRHPHYVSTVFAANDVIFVREDLRNSRLGLSLIRVSEREAKAAGARKITWHVKDNGVPELLGRLGYNLDERIMGKLL